MQTYIYLIRHGEVYNPQAILYGRLPRFGLSDRGKKQLQKTGEFLKDKQINFLYTSPLLRAKQSAEIIKKELGISPLHISDQIIEVRTSYQGKKFSDLDSLQSEVYLKPLRASDETIGQIAQRMQQFIKQTTKKHNGQHIAVVSHGDPIMIVKALSKNKELTFSNFKTTPYIQQGEVYQLTIDDKKGMSEITSIFKPSVTE
jgi:broad specificity phosphatase PhoE